MAERGFPVEQEATDNAYQVQRTALLTQGSDDGVMICFVESTLKVNERYSRGKAIRKAVFDKGNQLMSGSFCGLCFAKTVLVIMNSVVGFSEP